MLRLKLLVVLTWSVVLVSVAIFPRWQPAAGQKMNPESVGTNAADYPETQLVEKFDAAIQRRFLTEPNFGIRRMQPIQPEPLQSIHVGGFSPINEDERSTITGFVNDGWKVGLYLYGRQATPDGDKENPLEKFKISYRINRPVSVVWESPKDRLPNSKKLINEVKAAFLKFQADVTVVDYRFAKDDWSYVAKPVRAVNESCIRCHTDYVVTDKLENGQYKFRKRAVGDVNGVIVYGFSREKKLD